LSKCKNEKSKFVKYIKCLEMFQIQNYKMWEGSIWYIKKKDTAKYFQNGLGELVEIWHIVRNV
jgi:hypothetical protein